jgi:aspartyl-tRNA(Asn)/glutamyl-tRNA(Gln) amidotransferase subunit A
MIPDFLTIAEAGALISKRELSPVELVQSRLDRIERLDGKLNSFIRVLRAEALAAARSAEAEIAAGHLRGPLHGIPIGLKDIYETKGVPTTGHSKVLIDHVPRHDAASVRRLTDAGAIVLGKLATHEFAFGGPSFDLPWPPARNPWDTSRFTGGSSSGTGASVAAGLVLGGTGSDTGGSIRGPAALCGLAGLKPSYGRISRIGILPLAFSLDHAGPMAWTAEDCAIMLQAMAGHDPADPASADRPVPDYRAALSGDIKGLRIGLIRHFYESDNPANEATRQGIAAAVEVLEGLGCSVRELHLSPLADWAACGVIIMLTEAYAVHQPTLRERFTDYGEAFRDRMALAALIGGGDYVQAVRRRRELAAEFATAMADLDIAMTAASPSEAPLIDAVDKFAIFERPMLTMPFNVTGTPAMSVCCGYTEAGLPLAFQLAGKPFDEATVLKLAYAYEDATPWRSIRPRLDS